MQLKQKLEVLLIMLNLKPTFENISRAVAASLSLGILSIFVILIPVSIVGLFVLALFLISLLLLFCPIILLASAISRGIVDSISNVFLPYHIQD